MGTPRGEYSVYWDAPIGARSDVSVRTKREAQAMAKRRSRRSTLAFYVRNERTGFWSVWVAGRERVIVRGRRR